MEVDDAGLSETVEGTEKQVLAVKQSVKIPTGRKKETLPKLVEPPAGQGAAEEMPDKECNLTTPLEMKVSLSEGEKSDNTSLQDQPIGGRKVLGTPNTINSIKNAIEISLKRKRHTISRAGSEDELVGFDENTGEASMFTEMVTAASSTSSANVVVKTEVATPSTRPNKKLKQSEVEDPPQIIKMKAEIKLEEERNKETRKSVSREKARESVSSEKEGPPASGEKEFQSMSDRKRARLSLCSDKERLLLSDLKARPSLSVERARSSVSIERGRPSVSIERARPSVSIDRARPSVGIERARPSVSIERARPSVSIDRKRPSVTIERGRPSVSIEKERASVSIERERPSVSIERKRPSVSIEKGRPSVSSERGRKSVSIERKRPSVSIDRKRPSVSIEKERASVSSERGRKSASIEKGRPSVSGEKERPSMNDKKELPSMSAKKARLSVSIDRARKSVSDEKPRESVSDEKAKEKEVLPASGDKARPPSVSGGKTRKQMGGAKARQSMSIDRARLPLSGEKERIMAGGAKARLSLSVEPKDTSDTQKTNGRFSTDIKPGAKALKAQAAAAKQLSAQDECFKKPFKSGWKRELVWRTSIDSAKERADVYFISPGGKKCRTRSDISPFLGGGGDLTIDNFCFIREAIGMDPKYETVRHAKPSSRSALNAAALAASSPPTNIGKRISKPKGPKGASPPPQGWTPTRALKVNNAALMSGSNTPKHSHGTSPSATGSSRHSHNSSSTSKSSKSKKATAAGSTTTASEKSSTKKRTEPCSVKCERASGRVPQLQCVKCLCLFHHECLGLSRHKSGFRRVGDAASGKSGGRSYTCEACLPKAATSGKVRAASSGSAAPRVAAAATKVAAAVSSPTPAPAVASVAALKRAANPAASRQAAEAKLSQTISVVKGKKYVMMAMPTPRTENANDIENDLRQINESIRVTRTPTSEATAPATSSQTAQLLANANTIANISTAGNTLDHFNKLFALNFFANISFAFDALLCILKYLKIHERPRAASVCKLWHLAAKDTSLWSSVRMKNSRVCDWAGFTGALRRGETKHLDLRKMLVSSARSEDVWADFSQHIGSVCSLEAIDLCRCSAKVVESLFQSNKNLRILNAVAINDDIINLEHVGRLQKLEELRIRANEPYELTGNLDPLKALTQLQHLSLTSVRGLGVKNVEVLSELEGLRSLELGECGDFDSTFADAVLPRLKNLTRLRLENGTETKCCTLEMVEAAANMKELVQLELVNFDIKPGFVEKLSLCSNVRKLLIIPTYISQSATTNHIVLSAVQHLASTLSVFTWGVTVELLRVTALYVDQCEESTKKEKLHFDECIPVLKPVPGAPVDHETTKKEPLPVKKLDGEEFDTDVPQIEILPLDKIESILSDNLPNIKFTIVKIPYHATCKQQMVE